MLQPLLDTCVAALIDSDCKQRPKPDESIERVLCRMVELLGGLGFPNTAGEVTKVLELHRSNMAWSRVLTETQAEPPPPASPPRKRKQRDVLVEDEF